MINYAEPGTKVRVKAQVKIKDALLWSAIHVIRIGAQSTSWLSNFGENSWSCNER